MQTDFPPAARLAQPGPRDPVLWAAARELETAFLAEMLKPAGLGGAEGPIQGGIGEEQFSSFLRAERARQFELAGGIGLSESIYRSLLEGASDAT
jgi:Rod binding domain-containing protein